MPTSRPFVPAEPTLGWAQLRAPARPAATHPFSAPSVAWTHLGRTALHLAARVLGLEDLEKRIGHRTGAVMLTHFGGFPGPTPQLRALSDRRGLVLIEDCAQALLSSDGEVPVGTTGDAAVFSFRKTLPVPHGGALVFNGQRAFQLPAVGLPPSGATARGFLTRLLLRGELRLPNQGGALRRVGAWFSRRFRTPGAEREAASPGFDRQTLALGSSPLVARVARAHALASVVERRRRNFFHLLGALRGMAPPLVNELPPGVCPLFYPLWVGNKDEVLARLRAENVRAGYGWPDFHPRCDNAIRIWSRRTWRTWRG